MDRISRQVMFMEMAEIAAKRSSCARGNIGCLIVWKNNILSMGYNGPPPGDVHCKGSTCETNETGGCARSVHAEANALRLCTPLELTGADLYCTASPCPDCAHRIIEKGLARVFFRHPYRISLGIDILINAEISVFKVVASGYIINQATGELVNAGDLS